MTKFFKGLSLAFSAGSFGALLSSLFIWFLGAKGVTASYGVDIAPELTRLWLYPRIVWGGLWGFLFCLPYLKGSYFLRGLLYGIPPTLVQLFIIFPFSAGRGFMGFYLGWLTPVFVLIFNAAWGVTTGLWLMSMGEKG